MKGIGVRLFHTELIPDDLIDGGSTAELHDPPANSRPIVHDLPEDAHRRVVTLALIALLAAMIVGHYCVLLVMEWNSKKTDSLSSAFNASLPVVSGLVGSAITYYFTRDARHR